MPRYVPYTKSKMVGDMLATIFTGGGWLCIRPFWELYQWTRTPKTS
jgi:hypothetical protein